MDIKVTVTIPVEQVLEELTAIRFPGRQKLINNSTLWRWAKHLGIPYSKTDLLDSDDLKRLKKLAEWLVAGNDLEKYVEDEEDEST